MTRLCLVALGLAALAGCTSVDRRPSLASVPESTTDDPVPFAQTLHPSPTVAPRDTVPGPGLYNSDNKPVIVRSGLNSDPNNPSGMPGRPAR
jgi:hypothetical protein